MVVSTKMHFKKSRVYVQVARLTFPQKMTKDHGDYIAMFMVFLVLLFKILIVTQLSVDSEDLEKVKQQCNDKAS